MLSYLEDGITSARWAQVCAVSRSKARVELRKHWQFWRDLEPRGFGRATRFCPRPWDLPGEPGVEEDRRELAYCVLPGRLWAGPYPAWNGPRFEKLAQWGVDLILDLTTTPLRPPEEPACMPNLNADWAYMAYHADFLRLAAEKGRALAVRNFPLAPFGVPGRNRCSRSSTRWMQPWPKAAASTFTITPARAGRAGAGLLAGAAGARTPPGPGGAGAHAIQRHPGYLPHPGTRHSAAMCGLNWITLYYLFIPGKNCLLRRP